MFKILAVYVFSLLSPSSEVEPKYFALAYGKSKSPARLVTSSSDAKLTDASDSLSATSLIAFAQTLKGTPYKYACSDPKKGFDCSGFVQYVFKHFKINVPRSSVDFTHLGKTIDIKEAQPGDVILFTGTNNKVRRVGHVGIVTQGADSLTFIHASSGKTHGVTETTLNTYYKKRFVKVVRLIERKD